MLRPGRGLCPDYWVSLPLTDHVLYTPVYDDIDYQRQKSLTNCQSGRAISAQYNNLFQSQWRDNQWLNCRRGVHSEYLLREWVWEGEWHCDLESLSLHRQSCSHWDYSHRILSTIPYANWIRCWGEYIPRNGVTRWLHLAETDDWVPVSPRLLQ